MESSGIEQLKPSPEEGQELLGVMKERLEALQGIVDIFEQDVVPALREYRNTSRVIFSDERGYNDDQQRNALNALVAKLAIFENHVKAKFDLFDNKEGGAGLNNIFSVVSEVQKRLNAAPDARYTFDAQIKRYGGEENIPAGNARDTFEHTENMILSLESNIQGIRTALQFMNPKKVVQ